MLPFAVLTLLLYLVSRELILAPRSGSNRIETGPSPMPSPELFFDTMFAPQRAAALKAAIDLEVFTAIGDGAGTVAAIAGRCQASERGDPDPVRHAHDQRVSDQDPATPTS